LSPEYPTHNSLGYRGSEITIPKPEGVFRIVTLGGSTTYGENIARAEDTYPGQLQTILTEEYNHPEVEVINAGVGGYSSWESVVSFAFRVLDLEPDMIILFDAYNDISARLVAPEDYVGLNLRAGIWNANPAAMPPSTLYRFIAIKLGWLENPLALESRLGNAHPTPRCSEYQVECPELNTTIDQMYATNLPIYFERNLRNIIGMAQVNGVQVMLTSWVYFPEPFNSNRESVMSLKPNQDAIAEHNAIIKQLSEEFDLPYYDLQANFPYDRDLWFESMHLNEHGTRIQAQLFAAFIVESGLLD
jgi:hypothetical protein